MLGFAADDAGRTSLARRAHHGPLAVQRPFYPEGRDGPPHVYLLHPPGGLVGGDRLQIDIEVGPHASALVTTPAAGKAYRTAGPIAAQRQRLHVAAGGTLEWLPEELILYDGADVELATEIHLAPGARVVACDTLCFGLPARGGGFGAGRCRQTFEIWRGDRPLFVERGRFDGDRPVQHAAWGLGGAVVHGLLVAFGAGAGAGASGTPAISQTVSALRRVADALGSATRAAVTTVTDIDGEVEGIVCRYLGPRAEEARSFFRQAWAVLRPALLARPAVSPRIWST